MQFQNNTVDIIGVPDGIGGILPDTPTTVLAHDPVWFAQAPPGPHLTLAGHTHGGQIRITDIGIVTNASRAPLRWSNGLIYEGEGIFTLRAELGRAACHYGGASRSDTRCWM